ncbi:Putative ionotropic receptor IR8a, partial [Caligus rogercresseyi]
DLESIYKLAVDKNVVRRDVIWIFMHMDLEYENFDPSLLKHSGRFLTFNPKSCCGIISEVECSCGRWSKGVDEYIGQTTLDVLERVVASYGNTSAPVWNCSSVDKFDFQTGFYEKMTDILGQGNNFTLSTLDNQVKEIGLPLIIDIQDRNESHAVEVGHWQNEFKINKDFKVSKLKKIYRIGIVMGLPWAYFVYPNGSKSVNTSSKGKGTLEGYFPSLLHELRKRMNFDYELILTNEYGIRSKEGKWKGLEEEVIDFISPYIDMSGISIVIRKKKTTQSIFKFMTVLKLEVWMGTLAAVGAVTLLIWMLERMSPYSYSNARHLYPEGGRQFSFGESLWFSVTSLTPQGGGDSRLLAFIVLMLATFTSNLAAFLTVERLEKTVQSMEELIRHPKITYTVADSTIVHRHFINMAHAEKVLFEKWKNLTLNSGAQTQSEYRVWDYPIQEQYFHILQVINRGFAKVEEAIEGDFAFLHDTMESSPLVLPSNKEADSSALLAKPYSPTKRTLFEKIT